MTAYGDLGKNAKKVLSDGFVPENAVSGSINHNLPGNNSLSTGGKYDLAKEEVGGNVDLTQKFVSKEKNLTVTDKHGMNQNLDPNFSLSAGVSDFLAVKSMNLGVDHKGKTSLSFKNDFINETVEYVPDGPTLNATVCVSHMKAAVGLSTVIALPSEKGDTPTGPKSTSFAAGYNGSMFNVHVHADNDVEKVGCSLWVPIGPVEAAAVASKNLQKDEINAEVGVKVNLMDDLFASVKINSNLKVGVAGKKSFDSLGVSGSTAVYTNLNNPGDVTFGIGADASHDLFKDLPSKLSMFRNEFRYQSTNEDVYDFDNIQTNNDTFWKSQRQTYRSPPRKHRVGATPKELGENCTDARCKPIKREWE